MKRYNLDLHFYADDTQLYLAFKPNAAEQPASPACVKVCVSDIDLWMVHNKMKMNKHKAELLILSAHHRPRPSIEHIDISCERIQPSPSAKNIGVVFSR